MLLPHVIPADSLACARTACASRPVRAGFIVAALLLAVAWLAFVPSLAAGAACPSLDDSYTGNCGPMFVVPTWTDAGGWSDPSQYSTIRLADFDGDGVDELIGRSDAGVQIYRFDTAWGQWRPQVDADGVPQLLNDFASFLPSNDWDPRDPNDPEFYSTIQAADIDGQPGAEILGRFWDGMRVYRYTPPAGGGIDGGSWSRIGTRGPFSGYYDASLYSTIQVVPFKSGQPPMLFARAAPNKTSPAAPAVVFYSWGGRGWTPVSVPYDDKTHSFDFNWVNCSSPSCYLTLQSSNLAPGARGAADDTAELTGRSPQIGAAMWDIDAGGQWSLLNEPPYWPPAAASPPFGDHNYLNLLPDCPFSVGGATGTGSGDCVGSSPSYYETFKAADIDGVAGDELIARASDGLRVKKWVPGRDGGSWNVLPTLTALAGAASSVPDAMWGSIRTANIDGIGGDEVLFLDPKGKGLQAWSYDPGQKAWKQLPASPALALASDPWLSHPEYYSTIQTGDVDGDKREDVIARGPYGIRTWFYNRRGTGGWERYLADGYPAFSTPQQAALAKLTEVAKANQKIPQTVATIRAVWASENAPTVDLGQLQSDLAAASVGNCSGPGPANPPSYQACTPPAGSTGFTADEWKTVVNQLLSEAYFAQQVVGFFSDLKTIRDDLFLQQNADLPAIGGDLGLQAAASSTAQYSPAQAFSVAFGIAGSIAGPFDPEISAALWVVSEIAAAIPSSSPTAMSTFPTTYAGLQDKFAQMVSETEKGLGVMSQEVRQDAGLLGLVGQLRSRGTWTFDTIGMASAANQAFAQSVYQALMPTLYERYHITGCVNGWLTAYPNDSPCTAPADGPGVLHGQNVSQDFTTIAQPYDEANGIPCGSLGNWSCTFFNTPPSDLMKRIWGQVEPKCSYTPGKADTAWTFGCSAGVDPITSIGENTWNFTTRSGNPKTYPPDGTVGGVVKEGLGRLATTPTPVVAGAAARTRPRAPIMLGRPRHGHRRAVRGRAQLLVDTPIPRAMRLAGATIRLKRLLFERRGHGELTRAYGGRVPRPLKLRLKRAAAGRFTAATTGRRSVRIALRRVRRHGRTRLALEVGAAAFRGPRACHGLPASVAIDTPPLHLETLLTISDGRTRHRIVLKHHVRCLRDARGNIDRLVRVRPRRHPLRRGLAVSLYGPRHVRPGTTARFVAHVRNRRRGSRRLLSSLWDITLDAHTRNGHGRTARIHELRRGRSRRVTFTRPVPRGARGRFCAVVVATAPATRGVHARACAPVRAARARTATG